MIFFEHRRNRIADLAQVSLSDGVEIDIRSDVQVPGCLHLSHDPWYKGESFEEWLKEYKKQSRRVPLVLNTKEDGLESRIREILERESISNYLFLDTALPTFVRELQAGRGNEFFLRLSGYEDLENILKFHGKVGWVWADCFNRDPLPETVFKEAQKFFKICLVSPELQGGTEKDLRSFVPLASYCAGICTKIPSVWKELLDGI